MERVYVGNLPPDIRIKDIDDFFRPFGKLIYIDVNHRANPVYAYVQFDSARNAFNAVKSRHGYDYEGYTLQLRLAENEVRKRRDATPPPPPPPMFKEFGSQNNRGGFNNNSNLSSGNNNRMGGNFPDSRSSSFQSDSNSQWSSNIRSNMTQQQQNIPRLVPQQSLMNYPTNNHSNIQHQSAVPYSSNTRSNNQQQYPNSHNTNMLQQYSNSNRSSVQEQYSNPNNSNIQQQYLNSNRSNMQQQYPNSNRSNMQQFSNSNNSNLQQQYSNSNRLNIQEQHPNSNRSYMSQQNMMMDYSNTNRSDMFSQQNMNYSNRSNTAEQQNMNMMDYPNSNSWNSGNNNMGNMGWNSGNNGGESYNNTGPNQIYSANNDPYARPGFEDSYTRGLSGSGRKWFNRYIRKGFTPETARAKALEHRTVPYLRDDPKAQNPIPNDPTNVALETIGNTIISLLSTNPVDNWGGDNFQPGDGGNFDMPGPSSSRARAGINNNDLVRNMESKSSVKPLLRNRVSRRQYLKSLEALKKLRGKGNQNAEDRISKKYHTQIVKDYEQFEKNLPNPRAFDVKKFDDLSLAIRKKKHQLFLAAKRIETDPNKRYGGAFKKRMKILMMECGFAELEAKALAIHPLEKLKDLMDLKLQYNSILKTKDPLKSNKKAENISMKKSYRNDLNYLKSFEKSRVDDLSPRTKQLLVNCITRIHKHEKEAKLPLTKSKFTELLPSNPDQKADPQKKTEANQKTTNAKKTNVENKKKDVAETVTKKDVEKKDKAPTNNNKVYAKLKKEDVKVATEEKTQEHDEEDDEKETIQNEDIEDVDEEEQPPQHDDNEEDEEEQHDDNEEDEEQLHDDNEEDEEQQHDDNGEDVILIEEEEEQNEEDQNDEDHNDEE